MDEEYIGYLKYEGTLVKEGLLDARKADQALLGFDEAIRFYVGQQSPLLRDQDFEIPVRFRKGSWEPLIPVIPPPFLTEHKSRAQAAMAKFCFGVMR